MTSPNPSDPATRFALERLGPGSARLFEEADARARVQERVDAGTELEDAVLAEVHRAAAGNHELADEFIGYFLADLMQIGGGTLSSGLHQFVDTGDLVQSVLGDIWPVLSEVSFETRGQFLSFLAKRVDWKAVAKARKMSGERERRDGTDSDSAASDLARTAPTPLSALASEEDHEQIILRLMRLSERDQEILTLYIKEEPVDRIAEELGLTRAATYKALQRAIERFKALT